MVIGQAINQTINQTLNSTLAENIKSPAISSSNDLFSGIDMRPIYDFLGLSMQRFIELIKAPIDNHNMLWIVFPLLISLIVMQFYFGAYKKEKLGWNTAVGNSLALLFVVVDLIRHMYIVYPGLTFVTFLLDYSYEFIVIFIVAVSSFWLFTAEFLHFIPERVAFFVSSSIPVNVTAYVAIAVIYADVPVDLAMLGAAFLMFILLWILFGAFKIVIPGFDLPDPENVKIYKNKDNRLQR